MFGEAPFGTAPFAATNVASIAGQTISPSGIATAEAFGTAQLNLTLLMTGVASAEAFGAHKVIIDQFVQPPGIASAQAFGVPLITYDQVVLTAGIGSAEAFGSASLNLTLLMQGIAGGEAFGTASVHFDLPADVIFMALLVPEYDYALTSIERTLAATVKQLSAEDDRELDFTVVFQERTVSASLTQNWVATRVSPELDFVMVNG